jgi:hypothetical protein
VSPLSCKAIGQKPNDDPAQMVAIPESHWDKSLHHPLLDVENPTTVPLIQRVPQAVKSKRVMLPAPTATTIVIVMVTRVDDDPKRVSCLVKNEIGTTTSTE